MRLTAPPEFGDPLLAVLRASDPNAPRSGQEALVQRGAQLFGIDLVAFANRMIPGRMPSGGDGRDQYAINRADVGVNCAACHIPVQTTGVSPSKIGGRHLSNVWAPIFSDLLLHEGPEVTPERIASTPRDPVVMVRNGFRTLDLPRNLTDDALPNQGVANGKEFRTPPLMGIGRVGPPFFHDARVFLSKDTRDSFPLGTVYSDCDDHERHRSWCARWTTPCAPPSSCTTCRRRTTRTRPRAAAARCRRAADRRGPLLGPQRHLPALRERHVAAEPQRGARGHPALPVPERRRTSRRSSSS